MIKNQIICAAIKFPDGTIIRGHRHDGCYKYAMGINKVKDYLHQAEQGFIDARNEFVNRTEAMNIQIEAGLPSFNNTMMVKDSILFSEDLY